MESPEHLFPTSGRVPEERQIGRVSDISRLQDSTESGAHSLLFGVRRIGKSSVAVAVLGRLKQLGWLTFDLDLSRGITNSAELTSEILKVCAADGIEPGRWKHVAGAAADQADTLVTALGDLGITDDAPAGLVKMAKGLIGRTTPPDLKYALDLLQTICATDRRVAVFIDEIGNVAKWDDKQASADLLSIAMRADAPRPTFIFAGSRQEPIDELGKALFSETLSFRLSQIDKGAWEVELKARFDEANVKIQDPQVHEILFYSDSHPQDTMRLCSHCATWARSAAGVVDHDIIQVALGDARSNPLWGQR